MPHLIILGETFDCAETAATAAAEVALAKKINNIRERGTILQGMEVQSDPEHDAQSEAIANANNFAQSVCNGSTANRVSEAQNILNAINALL